MFYLSIPQGPTSTGIKKPPIPYGLKIYKGSKNMAVSRGFVDFIIYSEVSKQLKVEKENSLYLILS